MLNTARSPHHFLPALTLLVSHAGLHFLHTLSHPGAVGDVILRARYYAFISKYLDSTDLFVGLPFAPGFFRLPGLLSPFRPCFLSLRSHYPSLCSHCCLYTGSLLLSLCRAALLFLQHTSPHFASPPGTAVLLLRTCQSRAAVAAIHRILDTQYPSCLPEGTVSLDSTAGTFLSDALCNGKTVRKPYQSRMPATDACLKSPYTLGTSPQHRTQHPTLNRN